MRLSLRRWLAVSLLVGTAGVFAVPQAAGVTAVTRYVVSTGDDTSNDCTDSANPCASLQYATDQANAGDTIDVAGTIDSNVSILKSLTITHWPGHAPAVLDGTNSGRVVLVQGSGGQPSVTLSHLTIENGLETDDAGGGIANANAALTVEHVTLSNNSAFWGGGGIASGGTLIVEHSTFSNNSAVHGGGAIADVGTLTVEDSTFSGNSATDAGGGAIIEFGSGRLLRSTLTGNTAAGNNSGGGVEVVVLPSSSGPPASLFVADSTFTNNSAVAGGAIASNGSITVESSTLTGNSSSGGSAIASANRNVLLAADIFAKQASGTNCYFSVSSGPSVDAGYNVDDDGTCGLSSANHSVSGSQAIDHYLGHLADNGGPTQTVALRKAPRPYTPKPDPALGAVPSSFHLPHAVGGKTAACAVPDQRGVRPPAETCDIGAYQTAPPSRPRALTGRLAGNSLHLSWEASHGPAGVDHYVVYLDNQPIKRVDGTRTQASICLVCRHGGTVYTVRAFDPAGFRSRASRSVTVEPSRGRRAP